MSFQLMIGIVNFVRMQFNPALQIVPIQDLLQEHNLLSILKDQIHKLQEQLLPEILLKDLLKMTSHLTVKKKIISFLQERQELHIKINFKHKELQDQKPIKL